MSTTTGGGTKGTARYTSIYSIEASSRSRSVDIYSLGVLLVEILLGEQPYSDCVNEEQIMRAKFQKQFAFSHRQTSRLPPKVRELVVDCWTEPFKRFTLEELITKWSVVKQMIIAGPGLCFCDCVYTICFVFVFLFWRLI
jgi:serine/threonine protein kinase